VTDRRRRQIFQTHDLLGTGAARYDDAGSDQHGWDE
jgi:hypothetical protein